MKKQRDKKKERKRKKVKETRRKREKMTEEVKDILLNNSEITHTHYEGAWSLFRKRAITTPRNFSAIEQESLGRRSVCLKRQKVVLQKEGKREGRKEGKKGEEK